jgi:hypothetical protein
MWNIFREALYEAVRSAVANAGPADLQMMQRRAHWWHPCLEGI